MPSASKSIFLLLRYMYTGEVRGPKIDDPGSLAGPKIDDPGSLADGADAPTTAHAHDCYGPWPGHAQCALKMKVCM